MSLPRRSLVLAAITHREPDLIVDPGKHTQDRGISIVQAERAAIVARLELVAASIDCFSMVLRSANLGRFGLLGLMAVANASTPLAAPRPISL